MTLRTTERFDRRRAYQTAAEILAHTPLPDMGEIQEARRDYYGAKRLLESRHEALLRAQVEFDHVAEIRCKLLLADAYCDAEMLREKLDALIIDDEDRKRREEEGHV